MSLGKVLLSPPDVGEIEQQAVFEAVRSGWVAPIGPHLDEFERLLAELAGRRFAVGLSSGTAALHLGLLALGVKPDDYVICSTLTFVATANAVSYVGAKPVFVDSESSSGNLSASLLLEAINTLVASGQRVAAVVPVDFLGRVANYEEILPICSDFGIPVLADAAESVGARRSEKPAGSFGDCAVFSFNGNKIVTTSSGGAFLTDSAEQATLVRTLSTQARLGVRHYEHELLGFNYRMSNVLASIGIAQLSRLDRMISKRRQNRDRYRVLFQNVAGVTVLGDSDFQDNCWLTAIMVDADVCGFDARQLADFLEDQNIESRPLWKPMHLQPLYADSPAFIDGTAENFFQNGLALPSGSSLTEQDWNRIEESTKTFLDSQV